MARTPARARSVFISYHRASAHGHAQAFQRAFTEVLGPRRVFLDVGDERIPAGSNWRQVVLDELGKADALVVLVDPGLGARLTDQDGAVRFELEEAARLGRRIVPVRVDAAAPLGEGLPASLAFLRDVNSPEVRSDTSVADVNRIVEELTGFAPGDIRPVDRWDAAVLSSLVVVGGLLWASWGRTVWTVTEAWLWGALLALPMLAWWVGRRALHYPPATTGTSRRAYAVRSGALVLVLAAAWCVVTWFHYKVPRFPGDRGVLVTRFQSDAANVVQSALADTLRDHLKEGLAVGVEVPVRTLPRRVSEEDEARRFGRVSGASVVLWGGATRSADSIEVAVQVVFLDQPGVFQPSQGERSARVSGPLVGPGRMSLLGGLSGLEAALPELLIGYQLYVDAETDTDWDLAGRYIGRALSRWEEEEGDRPRAGALEDILAMLHFLRGNVRYLAGSPDSALRDYEEAVDHSRLVETGSPYAGYIEPLNNLVMIHLDSSRFETALEAIAQGAVTCSLQPRPHGCGHLAYHEGIAHLGLEDFARADSSFAEAIQAALAADEHAEGETEHRLAGYAYHNRAFSQVRRAAFESDPVTAEEWVRSAEEDEARAVEIMREGGLEPPAQWRVTVGRILIERGLWGEALETLESVMEEVPEFPPTYALAAAAAACLPEGDASREERAAGYMKRYTVLTATELDPPGYGEFARITSTCTSREGG